MRAYPQLTAGGGFNIETGDVTKDTLKIHFHMTRNEALHLAKEIVAQCVRQSLPFHIETQRAEELTRMMIAEALGLPENINDSQ